MLERLETREPLTCYSIAWDYHSSLHSLLKFWTYVDLVQPDLVVEGEVGGRRRDEEEERPPLPVEGGEQERGERHGEGGHDARPRED